ncbi:GNAT family N-acetyltransferase [Paenibacillus pini]|uniref:N-acetyltransferase domain-containing protein n=1 Tax=Paenibacillus pini JCM 16418 TaxID=1236976 RepID=W7YH29_9BACL|nr:GNAT family N-acetyltransferase [Paenibacillus pini]GAF07762.1 hypothetical protein JCM16418_1790 [Paenibacillus pini JCM 16418]
MEIVIRKFSTFTIPELTRLWNEGFTGYFFNMDMNEDTFIQRAADLQLSLELSIAACINGRPVGFVMNGVRMMNGRLTGWNGGTGIIPEYRNKGIGRQLIGASQHIYKEQGAVTALLEAVLENDPAIALYEKLGYSIIDRLTYYEQQQSQVLSFSKQVSKKYHLTHGISHDLQCVEFKDVQVPWRSHWASIKDGESYIAWDEKGRAVGYALYKRSFNEQGVHYMTTLKQCMAIAGNEDEEDIIRYLLSEVYGSPDQVLIRKTVHMMHSQPILIRSLEQMGFVPSSNLVHMRCDL